MTQAGPLTKVEQRLLNEVLAYREGVPSETPAPRPDVGTNVATYLYADRRHTHRRRRWSSLERIFQTVVVVVVAVAVVAVTAILAAQVLTTSGSPALAATPQPLAYHGDGDHSGQDVLLQLAAVAGRQPAPATPSESAYAYVKSAGWYLGTRVDGATSSSTVSPTITESWTSAAGSGRVIRRSGRAVGSRVTDTTGGRIFDQFAVASGHALRGLSANPAVVAQQLDAGHPTRIGPVERFVSLTDLSLAQPVPPSAESAILRVLADSPGLINSGSVTDRAGRSGVAVSLDSAYSGLLTRYTLIFDPRTAGLLGEEETLIGNPKKLDVRSPAVLAYTVFLSSGYVDSITGRP